MTKRLSLELRCFRYKVALYLSHMRYSNWLKVVTQSLDSRDLTSGDQLESLQDGHYRLIFYSRYNTVVWKAVRRGTVLSLLPVGNSTTTWDPADNKRSSYLLPGDKLSYCQGRRRTSRPSLVAVASTSLLNFTRRIGTVTSVLSNKLIVITKVVAVVRFVVIAASARRSVAGICAACLQAFPFPLELLDVADPLDIP